jgi:hypothetical protein
MFLFATFIAKPTIIYIDFFAGIYHLGSFSHTIVDIPPSQLCFYYLYFDVIRGGNPSLYIYFFVLLQS